MKNTIQTTKFLETILGGRGGGVYCGDPFPKNNQQEKEQRRCPCRFWSLSSRSLTMCLSWSMRYSPTPGVESWVLGYRVQAWGKTVWVWGFRVWG